MWEPARESGRAVPLLLEGVKLNGYLDSGLWITPSNQSVQSPEERASPIVTWKSWTSCSRNFFVASGICFIVADNEHFRNFLHKLMHMYPVPTRFRFSCTFLDNLFENKNTVDAVVKTASSHTQGVLCFEGCSNVNKEHFMNILVWVGAKIYFRSSLDTKTEKLNADIMTPEFIVYVEELGAADYV